MRRIAAEKEEGTELDTERRKTYDRLIVVQEELLRTIHKMKVSGAPCSGSRVSLPSRGWTCAMKTLDVASGLEGGVASGLEGSVASGLEGVW